MHGRNTFARLRVVALLFAKTLLMLLITVVALIGGRCFHMNTVGLISGAKGLVSFQFFCLLCNLKVQYNNAFWRSQDRQAADTLFTLQVVPYTIPETPCFWASDSFRCHSLEVIVPMTRKLSH